MARVPVSAKRVNTTPDVSSPPLDPCPASPGCRGLTIGLSICLSFYGFAMVAWAVFHA